MSSTKKQKSKKSTREKILKESKRIFARKGFDGARMDEIAQKAGVNKALIYYYFESKEKILEELINQFLKESIQRKAKMLDWPKTNDKKALINSAVHRIFDLFEGNEDMLKIIITEELKSEKKQWPLFQMLDEGVKDGLKLTENAGISVKKRDELIRTVFYFGFIPVAFFTLLKDEWAQYYKTDKEEDKKEFIEIMKKTYIRFLMEELIE